MKRMKRYNKVFIALIFVIGVILTATKVQAYTFSPSSTNVDPETHRFRPYKADGKYIYYCIEAGSPYKVNIGDHYVGETNGKWCPICNPDLNTVKPWGDDEKKSMTYTSAGEIDASAYQDAAYVMANASENGKIQDMETQWSIWTTSLNIGHHNDTNKGTWGEEAIAYRSFYNNIHSVIDNVTTDLYSSKVYDKTNIDNVNIQVNQTNKEYIVGPFTIEYPNGDYTVTSKKWSYITNITLLNQSNTGIGDVKNNTIHIIDSSGNELRDTINNNNFPNSNQEFYVKFSSTLGDIYNMKLKVDFEYLESCSATLQRFKGTLHSWVWNTEPLDEKCPICNGNLVTWKLSKIDGGVPQELSAYLRIENDERYDGKASKTYSQASLIVAPRGIDLTMKISGQVFLDRDSGKVNTGNNIMDGKNEALQGVEVVLYDAATNQIVTKTSKISQYHVHTPSCYSQVEHEHTGDPYTGGGCYTKRIHYHDGNWETGGACYENAVTHVHTGSPSGKIEYHHHTEDCNGGGTKQCIITHETTRDADGTYWLWTVHSSGGKCGQIWNGYGYTDRNLEYTITQYELDNIHPELKNWDSRPSIECVSYEDEDGCKYEEGQAILVGDGCYTIPVYHTHVPGCYNGGHTHNEGCPKHMVRGAQCFCPEHNGSWQGEEHCKWAESQGYTVSGWSDRWDGTYDCGKTESTGELICGFTEGQIERFDLGCGNDGNTPMYYELTCTKPLFDTECNNEPINRLICDKSNQIDNTIRKELSNPVITDSNGYYEFEGLDAMKKYYVKFVYNGMLYTNVLYNSNNADNVSKADETSRYDYRTSFNNKFTEIGSYPSNYKIVNKIFDNLGEYNKVYLQEDIADIFKRISARMVNTHTDNCTAAAKQVYNDLEGRYSSQEAKIELQRKIQFAVDCRIQSQTVRNYPLTELFTISTVGKKIGNVFYPPIYSGTYNQLHVNLGIKSRATFDMTLYKDVLKAEVSINGKTETYNYDSRKQSSTFKLGVSEQDYLSGLRGMYQNGRSYTNDKQTSGMDTDSYNLDMRSEEVANGNSSAYNSSSTGKVNGNYKTNEDYNLTGSDKLKITVTYKIAIRNESSITGAITELVDYYDTNYKFVESYVGDVNGNKTGDVTKYDNSMYSARGNNEYKSTKNAYTTIYLRPKNETRLNNGEEQYIYVVLELVGASGDAGTLLTNKLLTDNSTLNTMNLVEINGYKTYNSKTDSSTPGLIDKDSNPGNLNISNIDALTQNNIVNYPNIRAMYEDDTNRAPVLIYKTTNSKTIEGTVFEDSTGKTNVVTGAQRSGNGTLDSGEKGIAGVIVELVEIKNNQMIVRSTTKTNQNGWYGFTGFIPGDYVIRYTYGSDNDTALSNSSVFEKGLNDKSYNGQDYQSTTYTIKGDTTQVTPKTDSNLIQRYTDNYNAKNNEESKVLVRDTMTIDKQNNYWYTVADNKSDAKDYEYRTNQVIQYSKEEYGKEITNHKAEVFNSYVNPQPEHITSDVNKTLANELERRTYRYAYTPVIEVEVEYATKITTGNKEIDHKIMGVDFGIVERPKSELTIDQDVKHIKVTLADGSVIFDTETGTDNLQWIAKGDINKYDKNELINVIMDEEIINGATLEITYNLTVTNNSEQNTGTTKAKTILNYVANNMNFDVEDNKDTAGNALWKVVSKDSVQNGKNSTFVNNTVDLSTQSVILQATEENPLASTNLEPGQQVTSTLKLKKVLGAESSTDDLTYTNMSEIVEIDNTVGRYDHGATPGNQKLELQPREHDTSGASKYTSFDNLGQPDPDYPPDGVIIVTPPTGSNYIYYVIGITGALILAVGIFLIKKFVIDKKK